LNFEILFAANFIFAMVALVRLRGATFIIIANACAMLRAFSAIEAYGQPRSQFYLPSALFDPSRLDTAANIFTIVTVVSLVAVLLPDSSTKDFSEPAPLPPLPRWLLIGLAVYFISYFLSSGTIFTSAYLDRSRENFNVPHGGEAFLLQGLVVYELYRRVRIGRLTNARALGFLFFSLFLTDYSKGATGGPTGFIAMAAFLFFGREGRPWTRPAKVVSLLLAIGVLALFVRHTRATIYSEGTVAVQNASELIVQSEQNRAEGAEGLESLANGSQTACHVLECVYLYESGYSRDWRSLYDPIVYTFQPQFLMTLLGKERAIEPAWELGKYFIHGGGIAIFGEMYWNGGYPCVFLTMIIVLGLAYLADTRRDRGFGWLIFYCMYASCLGYGVGYGLTYLFRGCANALIVIALYMVFRRARAKLAGDYRGAGRNLSRWRGALAGYDGRS
jgi:hypothetical protein